MMIVLLLGIVPSLLLQKMSSLMLVSSDIINVGVGGAASFNEPVAALISKLQPPAMAATQVLFIGIMSSVYTREEMHLRNHHRELIALWNDTRVCNLHDFSLNPDSSNCEIIYTFVVAHTDESAPTQLLDDNPSNPLVLENMPRIMPHYQDIEDAHDITILNIRDNMNDGKTPTFFYFASQVARKYGIGYIMKCDSDSGIFFDKLLQFKDTQLPPTTSHSNSEMPVLASVLVNKATWKLDKSTHPAKEAFWDNSYYSGMHLYLAGQMYILSVDMAEVMVEEARRIANNNQNDEDNDTNQTYLWHHENKDATSMAEVGAAARGYPALRWIQITTYGFFWQHGMKNVKQWDIFLKKERERVANLPQKNNMIGSIDGVHLPTSKKRQRTLLVILGSDATSRKRHRMDYKDDTRVCPLLSEETTSNHSQCELLYIFAMEGNFDGTASKATSETVPTNSSTLFEDQGSRLSEPDYLVIMDIR
jgi:hypothetical protein